MFSEGITRIFYGLSQILPDSYFDCLLQILLDSYSYCLLQILSDYKDYHLSIVQHKIDTSYSFLSHSALSCAAISSWKELIIFYFKTKFLESQEILRCTLIIVCGVCLCVCVKNAFFEILTQMDFLCLTFKDKFWAPGWPRNQI